ncbi:methyltransferase domain-containing protein [Streptomyces sp. NPDC000927]|uniref:methyltransferase domain-containing protein n=1 Tax=Streptomyces sp. NPDC000927 TaxID=3154371 RepID=UPI0033299D6D
MTTLTDQPSASSEHLRRKLTKAIIAQGALLSPHWRDAFRTVSRHQFVDRFMVLSQDGEPEKHDLTDPAHQDAAMDAVYRDAPLVTQEDAHGTPTSSSSQPSMMARMLEATDLRPGMSVLEIGTGTGYNAALLSHALGSDAVTSVDIHPGLTKAASVALRRAGHEPTVVCGDGAQGHPDRAPYDRIIATCGVTRIPPAWLSQLKPGGIIVANLGFGLTRLKLAADGSLTGPFLGYASFMSMRGDTRETATTARDVLALTSAPGTRHDMPMLPVEERIVTFLRSVMMPGITCITEERIDGKDYILTDSESGSWARALDTGTGTAAVFEDGSRHLWAELTRVADAWLSNECPEISAYGLTVTGEGEHSLWLDSPERRRWLLSG